jgi:multidrug efflux pump subunit AcrA (membrane-fusion protein)
MAKSKRLKSRRARVTVVVVFLVVIGLVGFFVYRLAHGDETNGVTYTTGTAQKMTLTSSVSGTGNVTLSNTATISPGISGEVSGLSIAVGDTVQAGQVLFTIVNPELDLAVTTAQNNYDQAVLNLSKAELSVLQAKQSLSDLEEQYEAQSTTTTSAVTTSTSQPPITQPSTTTSLPPSPTTSTPPSPTTSQSSAQTTISLAPSAIPLSAAAAAGQTLLTSAATSPATGSTSASGAQTASKITYLDIRAAKQAVESAELSVTAAQTQVTEAQMALERAKENAAKRTVTAPISGTVTSLTVANGDTIGASTSSAGASSEGAQNTNATGSTSSGTTGSSVMTITDLGSFTASVTLAENDISSVEVGQKAVMTFDALPDLTLTGKVTSIDTTGTNNQGVVSYTVVVTPDVGNSNVKGGMTVSVNIITKVATDVLAVPSSAVKSQGTDGTTYVQVLENGVPTNVTVEAGMSTDSYTEIVSGLTEGQEIIVKTVSASAGNTTTTVRRSNGGLLNTGGTPTGGPPSGGFVPPGQ